MQTIKFETQLKKGVVYLPSAYRHWQDGKTVKITIQVEEDKPASLNNDAYHIIEVDELNVFSREELHER